MNEYRGFQEIRNDDVRLPEFYGNMGQNIFGCLENEYVLIDDGDGNVVDYYRWDGKKYVLVGYRMIKNSYTEDVKPRNPQQRIALDMLYNDDITVKIISGCFGSGKHRCTKGTNEIK